MAQQLFHIKMADGIPAPRIYIYSLPPPPQTVFITKQNKNPNW
jgi:hypothetical protein